ncbi:MAG: ZIP family metal transporter [Candidatus Norongarragalinales archaeon]
MVFCSILAAILAVCVVSLVGIAYFWVKPKTLERVAVFLVALSAGVLMGDAFLHLLPESVEANGAEFFALSFLASFSFFFFLERIVKWHHCHDPKNCRVHSFAYVNLFGDAVHNFIDGLIISASFIASVPLGITTMIAVVAHEIPQELSDFGVLVYAGFSKGKAIAYNFLSSLAALAGALFGFYVAGGVAWIQSFLLPFAAGGFVYIASSDLVPELHKQEDVKKALAAFLVFVLGLILMYALKAFFEA